MGVHVTERQLHLFRSRKQRGCAPPVPSEFQSLAAMPRGGPYRCSEVALPIPGARYREVPLAVMASARTLVSVPG